MVFLSCFRQFSEQGSHRAEIIAEIQAQLEACQQKQRFDVKFEISKRKNPRVLSFTLTSKTLLGQSVDFDVLPAFDALGEVPDKGRRRGRTEAEWFRVGGRRELCKQTTPTHATGKGDVWMSHSSPAVWDTVFLIATQMLGDGLEIGLVIRSTWCS